MYVRGRQGSWSFRTLSSDEFSANLSAAAPFHTRWLLYTVLSKQQNKTIWNCVDAHSREADAILRKIEDAALAKSEVFSPNPRVHIAPATGHSALVIGGALQRAAYVKSQTGHKIRLQRLLTFDTYNTGEFLAP
jgi:hypothetical protein